MWFFLGGVLFVWCVCFVVVYGVLWMCDVCGCVFMFLYVFCGCVWCVSVFCGCVMCVWCDVCVLWLCMV